jgi:RNA-binding protein
VIKPAARRTVSSNRSKRAVSATATGARRASKSKSKSKSKSRVVAADGDSKREADRPAPVLGARELRELRARAHELTPIVHVGHAGVSAEVLTAASRALLDHELIKVRLHEPEDKRGMAEALAQGTRAALCGLVGHTVILYRPRPKRRAREAGSRS